MTEHVNLVAFDQQIELWAIDDLYPNRRNARHHSEEQIEQLTRSIARFGFTFPISVTEDGTIIAGHGRYEAACELCLEVLPVIVARGWSDEMARAYALVDNRLAETSTWDEDLLRIELEALAEIEGFEFLSEVGFSEAEIEEILPPLTAATVGGLCDPDDIPEPTETIITRPGDIWVLGDHRLICGDATDPDVVRRLFDGTKPTMMVTDPPYGVEYDPVWRAHAGVNKSRKKMGKVANDDRADWREAWALFPGDVAYVWHGALQASHVEASLIACGFEIRSQIIWSKDRFALSRGHYHWKHEPCFYTVRTGGNANWQGDRSQSTVWNIPARDDGGHGHGTQKPVECMRRAIENNSAVGDAIYDPFAGSGTTLIAAEMTHRRACCIEINPAYVDIAIRRWSDFTGREAVPAETGESFSEVRAGRVNGATS